ncbi:MAG: prolyl oligopeptidase family serine peptidase [Planctomycetota bacterium]|jgi:dienelactone hydrolase
MLLLSPGRVFGALVLSFVVPSGLIAQTPVTSDNEIVLRTGYVTSPERGFAGRGRSSLPKDPLEAAWLRGELQLPLADQAESPSAAGLPAWKKVEADENGKFTGRELAAGWLVSYVEVPEEGIWLLSAQGHGTVRIHGIPRVGDIYSNGMTELPVLLKAGTNTLIFAGARGGVAARLRPVEKSLALSLRDTTFPHVIRGENEPLWGSLLVVNSTNETQSGLRLRVTGEGFEEAVVNVPSLPPLGIRKVGFSVTPIVDSKVFANRETNSAKLQLDLLPQPTLDKKAIIELDTVEIALAVRDATQHHRRTFLSQIDGSVQYYGVVPPAAGSLKNDERPALFLTLHGAGVEGEGQSACYAPKSNGYVIAPTNRRVFGFDWEDWGRWDALEVLDQAARRFQTNPRRTYLTGHSMGGHGTWHIGSLFPDRFAALGPSAGWISFNSYAGVSTTTNEDPIAQMFRRGVSASDTLSRVHNLASQGIYVLHGDADDNVPVGQARIMREELAKFHPDFVYKEQPGAGHWWGNACVDWPAMFSFFDSHQLPEPEQVNRIDFSTPAPHVSSRSFWAELQSQHHQGEVSRIELQLDRGKRLLSGKTTNVHRLNLNLGQMKSPENNGDNGLLTIDLDGSKLEYVVVAGKPSLCLERSEGGWSVVEEDRNPAHKTGRNGSFKEAFNHRFLLVYGTGGGPEENEWMLGRARYDAETFWYRGNGSVDVVSDLEWKEIAEENRSVIVYGNAAVNAAWKELLLDCPVVVERGSWRVPGRASTEEATVMMIRPRPGSSIASVGAIGGTTLRSMRSSHRVPIFSSGTGYPDLLIASPDYLEKGAEAVFLTGYFGHDWSFESGDWARGESETGVGGK